MKPKILIGVVLLYIIALILVQLLIPKEVESQVVFVPSELTPAQIIWFARLMDCESGINEGAINPNDLDNTPSWGILQFKPSTFESFTVKYGISAELMNAEAQVAIVTHWLLNPGEVDWTQQFPACVRKHGVPPGHIY